MRWFSARLLAWHDRQEPRPFPWIGERDPYKILLSEFLLQQTRSDQAVSYYERFLEKYPSLESFAQATEDDILSMWSGLGYYARGRNLLKCIQQIHSKYDGLVPSDRKELLSLPGIGAYTSAAVGSFAYDKRYPVVDGNVTRLLSRLFRIVEPINSGPGQKLFTQKAEELMPKAHSAKYNQAIMNYGATVCTPKKASCETCVFQDKCQSYAAGIQYELPIKKKIQKRKKRYFIFLILMRKNKIAMQKREDKDIWQGLFTPPFMEFDKGAFEDDGMLLEKMRAEGCNLDEEQVVKSHLFKQTLTHQIINSRFIELDSEINPTVLSKSTKFVSPKALNSLAMPRTVRWFFEKTE